MTAYAGLAALFLARRAAAAPAGARGARAAVRAAARARPAPRRALRRSASGDARAANARWSRTSSASRSTVAVGRRRSSGSSSCSSFPTGSRSSSGESSVSIRLGWDDERTLELTLRCARWGNYDARRHPAPGARPARPARLGAAGRPAAAAARLSAPRDAAPDRPARRDAALHRQRGGTAEGRRAGVRRPAPVRARRPRALDQLAGERAARRHGNELVVNERHPERNADVILFLDTFAEARVGRAGRRSTSPCARRRRSPRATSSGATASGSSRSAASSAG